VSDLHPFDGAMREALRLAADAAAAGEVPVGAVAVHEGVIVGRGRNRREEDRDPTAHAELLALQEAARTLGRWRLTGVTLVVTLEPCAMCAGALVLARIDRLVYGASDPKAGAVGSLMDLSADPRLNHRFPVERGLHGEACGEQLRAFFRSRRASTGGSGENSDPSALGSGGEIG
jgi:tRNA(adenine34) deaminase